MMIGWCIRRGWSVLGRSICGSLFRIVFTIGRWFWIVGSFVLFFFCKCYGCVGRTCLVQRSLVIVDRINLIGFVFTGSIGKRMMMIIIGFVVILDVDRYYLGIGFNRILSFFDYRLILPMLRLFLLFCFLLLCKCQGDIVWLVCKMLFLFVLQNHFD